MICPDPAAARRAVGSDRMRAWSSSPVRVDTSGQVVTDGLPAWFIPGSFRFCLHCGVAYDGSVRSDLTKLSGLSSEGRSSATTVLTLSALKYLIGTDLDDRAKKILGFTDTARMPQLPGGPFQ
ncbi:hypothetical protein F1715_11285 [Streptococcus pneumoniae]|nr:hypothetical protein F1715_11285 [Streptococcus pneumoniae]